MSPTEIRIASLSYAQAIQNHFEVVDEVALIKMAKKIEKYLIGG